MLARNQRLKKSELISRVLQKGRVLRWPHFTLKYLPGAGANAQLTAVIPQKMYRGIVARNRLRRRAMALLRAQQAQAPVGCKVVMILQSTFPATKFAALSDELARAFKQINHGPSNY